MNRKLSTKRSPAQVPALHMAFDPERRLRVTRRSERCLNRPAQTNKIGHGQEITAHALPRTRLGEDHFVLQGRPRSPRSSSPHLGRGSQLVFLKAPGSDEEIEICKFDGAARCRRPRSTASRIASRDLTSPRRGQKAIRCRTDTLDERR